MKHYLLKILTIKKMAAFWKKKSILHKKTRVFRMAKLHFFENRKDNASSDAKTYPQYSYKILSRSVN